MDPEKIAMKCSGSQLFNTNARFERWLGKLIRHTARRSSCDGVTDGSKVNGDFAKELRSCASCYVEKVDGKERELNDGDTAVYRLRRMLTEMSN